MPRRGRSSKPSGCKVAQGRIFWLEGAARDLGGVTPLEADSEQALAWRPMLQRASVGRLAAATLDRALLGSVSPLRLLIEGPGLLLEPCHFLMRQNHIRLLPVFEGAVAQGLEPVRGWVERIAEWIDPFWQLTVVAGRLIAIPERPLEVVLSDPSAIWGEDVAPFRPQGGDAGRVMRLLNDLQMLIKQHPWPLGEGVNTLWPWGDVGGQEVKPSWQLGWSSDPARRSWYIGQGAIQQDQGPQLLWFGELLRPLAERDSADLLTAVGQLQTLILPQLRAGDRVVLAGGKQGSTVLTVQGRNPLLAWFNRREIGAILSAPVPALATLW